MAFYARARVWVTFETKCELERVLEPARALRIEFDKKLGGKYAWGVVDEWFWKSGR
jgi:hypothetical protein